LKGRGEHRTFVESEWRTMIGNTKSHLLSANKPYSAFLSQCIRLRVVQPRALVCDATRHELNRLYNRVMDMSWRTPQQTFDLPPALLYWVELLQKCTPYNGDWDCLLRSIIQIAQGVARLYNDDRLVDWTAAERVMRDTIPAPTRWVMEAAGTRQSTGIKAFQAYRSSGANMAATLIDEIKRLVQERVIKVRKFYKRAEDSYVWHPWRYQLTTTDFRDLLDREKRILI
jgi:hypothetical protein